MSIFRRKKREVAPAVDLDDAVWTEADKALARARLESAQAMAEWPAVEKAYTVMAFQLEQNNFAERIRLAMGGK